MAILIIGGAGYIGSHAVAVLREQNREVVVFDNLQTGHRESCEGVPFYEGDLRDEEALSRVFEENEIEGVIHFAANSLVGESMTKPYLYYHNNVYGMLCLLHVMLKYNCKQIIFSSSAATYGTTSISPITEEVPTNPESTYGETKFAMERMMKWFSIAHDMRYVSLRYFNACGAHPNGRIGEDHRPETHLIPVILEVPCGQRECLSIFGDDYNTPDGTCIRDYIHVMDLIQAHVLAHDYLLKGGKSDIFNLGSGSGFSVKEVLEVARKVTGHPIPAKVVERRPGDPDTLVASSAKIKRVLGWKPEYEDLECIIQHAWNWKQKHPHGYGSN